MRKALAVVFLLLAGCADPAEPGPADVSSDPAISAAPFLPEAATLRFASGDYEGNLTGDATFSITAQCVFDCATGGEQVFDLSPIIPVDAPVELTVSVAGARADLEFVEANPVQSSEEFTGQGTEFAALVVRGETGAVLLHVYNPGGFQVPPATSPTASFAARGVVRADVLVPFVPAEVKLQAGDVLNVTGPGINEVLVFDPAGGLTRIAQAPFSYAANGTTGPHIVLVDGDEAVQVHGPNTTLTAKRLARIQGETQALSSGTEATWSFAVDTRPLIVGLDLRDTPMVQQFAVAPTVVQYDLRLTAPGGGDVVSFAAQCTTTCGIVLLGSGIGYGAASEFLDDRLVAGSYQAAVTYTGNGMQAQAWALVIL